MLLHKRFLALLSRSPLKNEDRVRHIAWRTMHKITNELKSMTNVAESTNLEDVFHVDILPALPHSAISLLQLSQKESAGPNDFAKPIEADPGLMGQVLRFVNSSYFGFSREIMSIPQAITLVGSRAIVNFALWNAVFSVIPNPKFGPFDLKALWQDSLRRAIFARKVGRVLKLEAAEDLFAGALLQDMAIPLLLKELPTEYEELVEKRASEGKRLSGLEKEMFGWNHADAAAVLATRWNLPEEFVELIAQHTEIEQLLEMGDSARGAACVALASLLPSCSENEWHEKGKFARACQRLSGMSKEDLFECLKDVDEQTAEFAPLLKLPVPEQSIMSFLAEK
ncbi:metal dependent phosphohydrolase [Rhodopirellula baltica SWK14]|uniref:Metal dependent phosphohydrolase n=1 Tax=Rhodopirellula baltica SWK14 TaxID=993516 RepID=L7CS48_RHOBT|nr:metal dependent phosphohydrolase [Rhodopirellula baltica SWK14]